MGAIMDQRSEVKEVLSRMRNGDEQAAPLLSRGGVAATSRKISRSHITRSASAIARSLKKRADGVVSLRLFLWTNTTPSAPAEEASRHLVTTALTIRPPCHASVRTLSGLCQSFLIVL